MRTTQEVWAASRPIQRPAKPIPETKARRTATGLAEPRDGQRQRRQPQDLLVRGEEPPHRCLTATVKTMARTPISTAQASATSAAARAPAGRRAPSSLPTRVETPRLSEDGKT
ncbi:unnamed protein product [Spirodela intermedia]|uniref:Uncharacterized protein n=1 Tax=Spirodela intermedia TaxID=51605 RepID=A0A7I8IIJ5_SPIIN|nr:unnamed protein product [Spirodela intermedia]CAA6657624.1 unnamed protein product [Spirodela intermedia]